MYRQLGLMNQRLENTYKTTKNIALDKLSVKEHEDPFAK